MSARPRQPTPPGAEPAVRRRVAGTREPGAPEITNAAIARTLREIGEALEIEGANPFRVRAYQTASRSIASLGRSVSEIAQSSGLAGLEALPGVGASIAAKLQELLTTGSLVQLEELRREVPPELSALLGIAGLGPKRLRLLHDQCGVRTLQDLERVLRDGSVLGVAGFGERSRDQLLQALERHRRGRERLRLVDAEPHVAAIVERLRATGGVEQVEVAGSFRRRRETIGDLDVLCVTRRPRAAADAFVSLSQVEEVLAHGPTRCAVRLQGGLQVDLRVVPGAAFGAALHYFTGSKEHNVALRALAKQRGYKVSEYGAFRGKRRVAGRTEEEIFALVGACWVPPELRENRGELEAAIAGELPALIEAADLRGDLHAHTTASDGRHDAETMARAARALGHEYLALTDHSQAVRVVRGLDDAALRAHAARLRRLRVPGLRVLAGVEVDILRDGALDLGADVLGGLDLVIGSVHQHLSLPRDEMTRRVLRAVRSGFVDVLGHPTGRKLGQRDPVAIDLPAVVRECAERGVAVEINARPSRLDLSDVDCRMAKALGASIVISSDAHSTAELELLRYGIDVARRGWLERGDVLNTLGLDELLAELRRLRRRRGRA